MKITGGNFGLDGSAFIHKNTTLVIEGATPTEYKANDIASTNADTTNERKTSALSIVLGIALTIGLTLAFSIIGFAVGLAITFIGSTYSVKYNELTVVFNDDKIIKLRCTPKETKKLTQLALK